MKKLFTLCFLFCIATMVMAQAADTFQFIDSKGNVVADGTTIVANTLTVDDITEDILIPAGLYIKNTAGEEVSLRIHCQLQTLDNGLFQICFPTACISKKAVETFDTPSGPMNSGEIKNLQTEWLPTAYGKCMAVYQVEMMKLVSLIPLQYESLGMGPSVTVEYVYADPASIGNAFTDEANEPLACYDLNGTRLDVPRHGLNIVRMKNGQVVKQLKR